ncbi:MAG: caspase family protein [Bacteroidota bacterium]
MLILPWVQVSAQLEIYVQPLQSAPLLSSSIVQSVRHPSLERIAFTSAGKELIVVESGTMSTVFSYPQLPNNLAALRFSAQGMLVTARIDGQLNTWDVDRKAMEKSLTVHSGGLLDAAFNYKGDMILAGADNVLKVYDLIKAESITTVSLSEKISSFALHPDGKTAAVGFLTNKIGIYDSSLALKSTIADNREIPTALMFSPDGTLLVAGGNDGTIRVWDFNGWKFRGSQSVQRGVITSIAFDPGQRWFASVSGDSTLTIYDTQTLGVVKSLKQAGSAFTTVLFTSSDSMLTGNSTGTIALWKVLDRPPDTTAPTLTILRPARYSPDAPGRVYATSYEVFGLAYDENEIQEVMVGSVKATLKDPQVGNSSASEAGLKGKEFQATVPLSSVGLNRLDVVATDASGNSSGQVLHLQRLSNAEAVEILSPVEGSETDNVAIDVHIKPWFDVSSYTISANTVDFVDERGPLRIKPGDSIKEEIPLIVGYNQINVSVTRKGGERFTKIVGVTRKFSASVTETKRRADPGSPKNLGPQRWAVIVGVSEYGNRGIPALKYADRDAEALAAFLQTPEGGGFDADHMRVLVNKDATLSNLREAMIDFLQQAIDKDLVVIYFAGHGAPDPTRPQNLYLLTYDTDPSRLGTTAFPMWDIQTVVSRQIAAKKVVVLSDACHSGGISVDVATRGLDVTSSNPINQYLAELARTKDGMVVFTASAAGEVSQEFPELGHGVFTYYLLEGLKGAADTNNDLLVTVNELMGYVEEQVKRKTRGAQNPTRSQTTYDKELPMSVLNK